MKKYAIALIIVLLLAGVATAGPQHTRGAASTATQLAANGANCPAGQAPLGVDASGAAEGCFAVATVEADPIVKAIVGIVKSSGSAISAASPGTDYVVPGGNVATATALAADPANCPAGQIAIGVNASGVAECTATPSGLTSVGATTFTGALSGNASTASALAANGANCSAGQAPLGVDASGAAEGCFGVVTAETDPVVKAVVGIVKSNGSAVSAASAGTDYVVPGGNVATATALAADPANCAAGQIAIGVNASGVAECTATPSGLTSVDATTFTGALTGNASTATALAANGANCSAGESPLGVDASGAAEGCFAVITSITGAYSTVDFTVKSLTAAKANGVAGASLNYEANGADTSVVGWMGPASITESWAYQFSSDQPTAGQVMVFAAPSGSGGPGGMKTSAQTWATPMTASTTNELTNKTIDVDGTGNVVKSWGYLVLTHPHLCAAGAPMQTTSTANTFGQCKFGNGTDKATNYAEYYLVVPPDIDTSVDLTATFKIKLGGADTGDHEYEISFDSVANSAAYAGSLGDAISLAYTADASGADGDVETAGETTLTGWRSAMTAGQLFVIRVARDGDHANDGSTVDSYSGPLVIKYKISQ